VLIKYINIGTFLLFILSYFLYAYLLPATVVKKENPATRGFDEEWAKVGDTAYYLR